MACILLEMALGIFRFLLPWLTLHPYKALLLMPASHPLSIPPTPNSKNKNPKDPQQASRPTLSQSNVQTPVVSKLLLQKVNCEGWDSGSRLCVVSTKIPDPAQLPLLTPMTSRERGYPKNPGRARKQYLYLENTHAPKSALYHKFTD